MRANKHRIAKKSKTVLKKAPAPVKDVEDADVDEMDADELDLIFWGSPFQGGEPKFAEN
jgi:hypothetical protein